MVIFQTDEYKAKARQLSTHGGGKESPTDPYLVFSVNGFNYRLSDINAAIGIEQLKKIDRILINKLKLAQYYMGRLKNNEDILFQAVPEGYLHNFQSLVIKIRDGIDRDKVIRRLFDFGIESTLGTYSLSLQPSFQKYISFATPVGQSLHNSTLTLPLFEGLTFENIEYICSKLESVLQDN
jgi:dTDP-4-amino-4,6-dideoxygalactose transaminase